MQELVEETLGPDGHPVLNEDRTDRGGITSADTFAQWYTDVPGVNQTMLVPLSLSRDESGTYTISREFTPIDDELFGDNLYFTAEIHTRFTYEGGELFSVRADDDLWLFINGKLALDQGGVHGPSLTTTAYLDEVASDLGITGGSKI